MTAFCAKLVLVALASSPPRFEVRFGRTKARPAARVSNRHGCCSLFDPEEAQGDVTTLRRMIQDQTVLHHIEQVDITDQVIERLDTAYQSQQSGN